jgi:hypothetical protein
MRHAANEHSRIPEYSAGWVVSLKAEDFEILTTIAIDPGKRVAYVNAHWGLPHIAEAITFRISLTVAAR